VKKKPVILILVQDWRFVVATVAICFVCFAYMNAVVRVSCFLVSVVLAIVAYCYFEHAVLFHDQWKTATTGKRRTPPGQSMVIGSVFLLLAIASMIYAFHH
jgi:hypothetical protein